MLLWECRGKERHSKEHHSKEHHSKEHHSKQKMVLGVIGFISKNFVIQNKP